MKLFFACGLILAVLLCIVPRDPAATVCVNVTRYTDETCLEVLESYEAYCSQRDKESAFFRWKKRQMNRLINPRDKDKGG